MPMQSVKEEGDFEVVKLSLNIEPYKRREIIVSDILCLQEVDDFYGLRSKLSQFGYGSLHIERSGSKKDGCSIFYRESQFQLEKSHTVELNRLFADLSENRDYWRDNVGVMAILKPINSKGDTSDTTWLCVANTHLFWNPVYSEVKFGQIKAFIHELELFNDMKCPTILCGDLNSLPDSAVYQIITQKSADYDHVDFRTLSPTQKEELITLYTEFPQMSISSQNKTGKGNNKEKSREIPDTDGKVAEGLHEFDFKSAYSNYSGSGQEPPFTNYQEKFNGTLDYIFYTHSDRGLKLRSILEIPPASAVTRETALPNEEFPSDHLALKASFSFVFGYNS